MILTNDKNLHNKAKHLSTTAKLPHRWEFNHDEIGFNFRMPNLNAALGLAQLEMIEDFIISKRDIALKYQEWGIKNNLVFIKEQEGSKSNYWLNCLMTEDRHERDSLLEYTNSNNVMTRNVGLESALDLVSISINRKLDRLSLAQVSMAESP